MQRAIHRLTPDKVQRWSKKPGMYPDGQGLYLCVSSKRAAVSWIFRYMLDGKAREMGLGSYPEVPLDTPTKSYGDKLPVGARQMAAHWRSIKAAGKDPIEIRESERAAEKLQAAKAITFRQCAEAFMESREDGWRNARHREQWKSTLETYVYPHFGDLPVADIDGALVHKALDPIWKAKTETASRVRGRIEAVLDLAKTRGYRTGDNPARWKGNLEHSYRKRDKAGQVKHHPALPYADAPEFMESLRVQDGIAANALQFTILTATRTGEVIGAKWDEFDLDAAVWTVPAERMKNGKQHTVPLSKAALAILREQHKLTGGSGYVFPGQKPKKPLSIMAISGLLERMGRDDITVHGFRSTFRDWAAEQTNFPREVCEHALAHSLPNDTDAAYRRSDLLQKRSKLMAAWATYCTTAPAETGKVLQMNKQAARPA